jgi:transcriptional regulator with XRE-family HTH domain
MSAAEAGLRAAVARELRDLRIEYRASQMEVAAALGCDQSLISRLEAGDRRATVEDLLLVASAVGASLERLMESVARLWALVQPPPGLEAQQSTDQPDGNNG